MRLSESVYWVGAGFVGIWATDKMDCNVYLLKGPDGFVMIDAGSGEQPELIERQMRWDGVDPSDIVGIVPPERYPRAVWDHLVRQKRLLADGQGTYELPPGG